MNLVDSSAWLEYFADGPNASFFEPSVTRKAELIVPTIVIYEVCKRVLQQRSYTRYFRGHVVAVANYNPDNWRLSAGASYDSFDWQPTELVRQRDGGITSFSNRNRDESLANPFLRADDLR